MAEQLNDIREKFRHLLKRRLRDVVALDFHPREVRALRVRSNHSSTEIVAAGRFDPIPLDNAEPDDATRLDFPPEFRAPYAAMLYPGEQGLLKILSLPGTDPIDTPKVCTALGIEEKDDVRVTFQILQEASRRSEASILVGALPESAAIRMLEQVPSGRPAPIALGLSTTAILDAFNAGRSDPSLVECLVFIEAEYSFFAFFCGPLPVLFRRMPIGADASVKRLQQKLGVDAETAAGILDGGVVDVSGSVEEIARPLLRQVSLSRDFIERHMNRSVTQCWLGGDPLICGDLRTIMEKEVRLDFQTWNPFADHSKSAMPEALSDRRQWAFTAALGMCQNLIFSES